MYTLSEFSELTGLSEDTLRNYDSILNPHKTPGGHRRYTDEHLHKLYQMNKLKKDFIDTVIYCRVSTSQQKSHLENQIDFCQKFCVSQGFIVSKVITDIGSVLNFNRKGLTDLIRTIITQKPKRLIIASKDRLLRIGFEMIQTLCDINDVELIVIQNYDVTSQDKIKEITDELVHIVHLYAMKLYGARSYKRIKKLEDQALRNINENESNS